MKPQTLCRQGTHTVIEQCPENADCEHCTVNEPITQGRNFILNPVITKPSDFKTVRPINAYKPKLKPGVIVDFSTFSIIVKDYETADLFIAELNTLCSKYGHGEEATFFKYEYAG